MEKEFNKYGLCPNCKESWDGGDILEELTKMDIHSHRSRKTLLNLAAQYGYTEENKLRFTRLIGHDLEGGIALFECPNIRCGHVFDRNTGQEYESIRKFKILDNARET